MDGFSKTSEQNLDESHIDDDDCENRKGYPNASGSPALPLAFGVMGDQPLSARSCPGLLPLVRNRPSETFSTVGGNFCHPGVLASCKESVELL
jgi:hypothetical protein